MSKHLCTSTYRRCTWERPCWSHSLRRGNHSHIRQLYPSQSPPPRRQAENDLSGLLRRLEWGLEHCTTVPLHTQPPMYEHLHAPFCSDALLILHPPQPFDSRSRRQPISWRQILLMAGNRMRRNWVTAHAFTISPISVVGLFVTIDFVPLSLRNLSTPLLESKVQTPDPATAP